MEFFKDCRFVLQADRRGSTDFVTDICGSLSSLEFQQAVSPILERYGYAPCTGMMTDVETLRDNAIGISVANISAGYHRPHTADEYIVIPELVACIALMTAICEECEVTFPFVPEKDEYRDWYKSYEWTREKDLEFPTLDKRDRQIAEDLLTMGYSRSEILGIYSDLGSDGLEEQLNFSCEEWMEESK